MSKTTSWILGILVVAAIVVGVVYASNRTAAPAVDAPIVEVPVEPSTQTPGVAAPTTNTPAPAKSSVMGDWVWTKTIFITGTTNPTGAGQPVVPAAGKFVATFGTDLSFSSTTDCNALKGKYVVDDEILSIGPVAATKMGCPAGSLESEYTKELTRSTSHSISGNELHIHLLKDTGTMIFTRKVKAVDPAPVALNGTTFRLDSRDGIATSAGSKYTLTFKDGALSAKFCNGLGGSYTVANGILKVSNLVGTMMYCGTPADAMTLESAFGALFTGEVKIAQSGNTLTLTGAKGEKFVYTVATN